ncbi:hypothetical protein, partial [Mesorhizobium japonicum]|uniref:hypothetical protein n=1 Tax=Mesorhizobium japonicum TaxID=2066070 RepID=UPI003B5938CB
TAGILAASAAVSCGSRLFWSSVFELVAEHASAEGLAGPERWFALLNVLRTVGIVAGGLISGVALAAGSAAVDVALAAASGAGYLLAAGLLVAAGRHRGRRSATRRAGLRLALRDPGFLRLLGLNVVFATATLFAGLSLPTVVRSALHGPGWFTALLLVVNALLVALLGRRGGLLAEHHRGRVLLMIAGVLWAAAFALVGAGILAVDAVAWSLGSLGAGVVLLSLAEVLHAPASTAWVARMAPVSGRSARLALFQYSFVAAERIGPVLFATCFSVWPPLPFFVVALAGLAASALLAVGGRTRPSRA